MAKLMWLGDGGTAGTPRKDWSPLLAHEPQDRVWPWQWSVSLPWPGWGLEPTVPSPLLAKISGEAPAWLLAMCRWDPVCFSFSCQASALFQGPAGAFHRAEVPKPDVSSCPWVPRTRLGGHSERPGTCPALSLGSQLLVSLLLLGLP